MQVHLHAHATYTIALTVEARLHFHLTQQGRLVAIEITRTGITPSTVMSATSSMSSASRSSSSTRVSMWITIVLPRCILMWRRLEEDVGDPARAVRKHGVRVPLVWYDLVRPVYLLLITNCWYSAGRCRCCFAASMLRRGSNAVSRTPRLWSTAEARVHLRAARTSSGSRATRSRPIAGRPRLRS